MPVRTQEELLNLVDAYIEANKASNGHVALEAEDAAYEEGYAEGLSDGRDALTDSIAIAGKLVKLASANAGSSAYDRGYIFALTDIAYIIDHGVLPGTGK